MAKVRFWRSDDLPHLLRMAALTIWEITPPDDKPATTFGIVAKNARQNVINVLTSPYGTAVVADEDGFPVGYLLIAIQQNDKTGEPQGYLADIYIEPPFRRGGLSKELHRLGEEYLRRLGIRHATTWTHAHNDLGKSTAAYHGYEPWGVMMVKQLRQAEAKGAGV